MTCLGVDTPTMLRAILPVFPLDKAVTEPAAVMIRKTAIRGFRRSCLKRPPLFAG